MREDTRACQGALRHSVYALEWFPLFAVKQRDWVIQQVAAHKRSSR